MFPRHRFCRHLAGSAILEAWTRSLALLCLLLLSKSKSKSKCGVNCGVWANIGASSTSMTLCRLFLNKLIADMVATRSSARVAQPSVSDESTYVRSPRTSTGVRTGAFATVEPFRARAPGGRQQSKTWSHTPSNLTLIWLAISLPLVIWDTGYTLLRPHSMPGGSLHWPLWKPYDLYGRVDHVYVPALPCVPQHATDRGYSAADTASKRMSLATAGLQRRVGSTRSKRQRTLCISIWCTSTGSKSMYKVVGRQKRAAWAD